MLTQEDLIFMLKCLHINTFNDKFTTLVEGVLDTDHETTMALFAKDVISIVNDRLVYEVNNFISFIESILKREDDFSNYSFI